MAASLGLCVEFPPREGRDVPFCISYLGMCCSQGRGLLSLFSVKLGLGLKGTARKYKHVALFASPSKMRERD